MTKVLVITYYWPPAGGPGVQRWLNFVRYLPEFNIVPAIFIPENPYYPIKDESLLAMVPEDLQCFRQKSREPYHWTKWLIGKKTKKWSSGILTDRPESIWESLAIWIRGNWFIPDTRRSWVKPASQKILEILKQEDFQAVITTGPPHSLHLIGLRIKERSDVSWIADFRDPWTSISYHKRLKLTNRSQRKHMELERKVLESADKIITTSQTTAQEFRNLTVKPVVTITNGFEPFNHGIDDPLDIEFSLSFIGSLHSDRNPTNLWKVLQRLTEEDPQFKEDLRLKFIGLVSDDVLKTIKEYQLEECISVVPYVPHQESRRYQHQAQILLLLEADTEEKEGIIPGKLFEYLEAARPILAIGPDHWEAGQMVEETSSGKYFTYGDEDSLNAQLIDWYQRYRSGLLELNTTSVNQFTRRSLTEKLAKELRWE